MSGQLSQVQVNATSARLCCPIGKKVGQLG